MLLTATQAFGQRPEISSVELRGDNQINVTWDWGNSGARENVDFWNLRVYKAGVYKEQLKIDFNPNSTSRNAYGVGGSALVGNIDPQIGYTFEVEGCQKSTLSHASCTAWSPWGEYFPNPQKHASTDSTCKTPFVWREATKADHVCVTTEVRTQTQQDNAAGSQRVLPDGTCRQGYVWRQTTADDHVCVLPATREEAELDNAAAPSRTAAR
jgi:hypothetical protein